MFGGNSGDEEPESYTETLEATAEIPINNADSEQDAIQQARSDDDILQDVGFGRFT